MSAYRFGKERNQHSRSAQLTGLERITRRLQTDPIHAPEVTAYIAAAFEAGDALTLEKNIEQLLLEAGEPTSSQTPQNQ